MGFDPYGIHIGFLYIRYYGMIIMFAAVAAAFLGRRMLRKVGQDPEIVWDGLIWLLVFGIIGARLYHVFTPSQYSGITTADYLRNPVMILTTWKGGLGMPGAIIGGILGAYLFARRRKLPLPVLLDAAAPAMALAQTIGRWGNFVNQELYGQVTDLPWCIRVRPENLLPGYEVSDCFHPLFLYESIWNLGNMFFLLWLWNRFSERLKPGDLLLVYLITYPIGRALLEFLRLDYVLKWGVNFNQALMILVVVISGMAIFIRHRKRTSPA
jgi:phosphatidylglycerol:prolipoprotein diacylglycerol transferase